VIAGKRASPGSYCGAGGLIGSCVYLCANLFALPGTPFLLGGDQALFWMNAQRLLHGEFNCASDLPEPGSPLVLLADQETRTPMCQKIWEATVAARISPADSAGSALLAG
jgi:hypothetical protein